MRRRRFIGCGRGTISGGIGAEEVPVALLLLTGPALEPRGAGGGGGGGGAGRGGGGGCSYRGRGLGPPRAAFV